jgi:hypothetical protein
MMNCCHRIHPRRGTRRHAPYLPLLEKLNRATGRNARGRAKPVTQIRPSVRFAKTLPVENIGCCGFTVWDWDTAEEAGDSILSGDYRRHVTLNSHRTRFAILEPRSRYIEMRGEVAESANTKSRGACTRNCCTIGSVRGECAGSPSDGLSRPTSVQNTRSFEEIAYGR